MSIKSWCEEFYQIRAVHEEAVVKGKETNE